jgi:hypothetical protein
LLAQQRINELPTLPETLVYIWNYWQELSYTRRNYGWGVTPLSYSEIFAWSRLRGILLDAWELDTLMKLDSVYLDVESKAEAKRRAANGGS